MPDVVQVTADALTPRQRAQVRQLAAAGAFDQARSLGANDPGMEGSSPLVIGALRDRRLAESCTVKKGARGQAAQFTAYWLTTTGAAVARRLAASPPPARRSVR